MQLCSRATTALAVAAVASPVRVPLTPLHTACIHRSRPLQPTLLSKRRHDRQQHGQQQLLSPIAQAAGDSSSSSGSGAAAGDNSSSSSSTSSSSSSKPGPGTWFDRLPPRTQLMIMGGLLFIGTIVIPFLQPTFLYGDGSIGSGSKKGSGQIVEEQYVKRELPRYIPVASELYSFLQDNSMPRTLPDGRTESPGVLRIYMSSMIILGLFYVCSAVVSVILRGVAGILRAVGVMGPAPPPKPEAE